MPKTPVDAAMRKKIKLLEEIHLGHIDWMESYRQTYSVPHGHGLPSGLTGTEAVACLTRRILKGERVVIVSTKIHTFEEMESEDTG